MSFGVQLREGVKKAVQDGGVSLLDNGKAFVSAVKDCAPNAGVGLNILRAFCQGD